MMIEKRLAEMKDLVTYVEIRPRATFGEKKLVIALKDAIAEIEELHRRLEGPASKFGDDDQNIDEQ